MAKKQKVSVEVSATDAASGPIKKVETRFQKLGSTIKSSKAAIASVTVAIYGLVRALGSMARAAFDSENAVRKVEAAMKTTGDFSRAASEDMQAFAKGLQSVGTESDESILSMIALAKGFVGTNEEAKKLVQTALDFKEIAGIAFEESVRRIGRATGGSTEDIAKFDSRILELTKTQLRNGEATRLLGEKYAGLNKAMSETAEGGLTKLENAWQDVQAAAGKGALGASEFSETVGDLTTAMEENVGAVERFSAATTIFFAAIAQGVGTGHALWRVLTDLSPSAKKAAEALREAAEAARDKGFADDEAAFKAKLSKEEQEALTTALKAQADAYTLAVESAKVFGEVTSVQLEGQMIAIAIALHDQKVILGETNVEYQRLADVAGKKIDLLKLRIDSLRDGMGDLKEATTDAADGISDYATAAAAGVRDTDALTASVNRSSTAYRQQGEAAASAGQSVGVGGGGSPFFPGLGGGTFTTITPRARVGPDGRIIY